MGIKLWLACKKRSELLLN